MHARISMKQRLVAAALACVVPLGCEPQETPPPEPLLEEVDRAPQVPPQAPPEPLPDVDHATQNLVAQGNIQYRQLRFNEALAQYDQAIEKEARYPLAHSNRGLALHKLGRLEDATAALEKAVELDGGKAAFHLNLGKVNATAGRHEDALASFDKALQRNPRMNAALYNRIWVLDQQGQIDKAAEVKSFGGTVSNPSQPGSVMLRGIVEARRGEADSLAYATCRAAGLPQLWRWLAMANRSLATGGAADMPADARDALYKGIQAASTEQFDAALKHFSSASAAAPKHPLPPWFSAMLLTTSGDHQGAEAAMKRAAPLMPTFSIPASDDPTVLITNGVCIGSAPVKTSLLPGAHLVAVVRRNSQGCAIFNKCGVFRPGIAYNLPAVEFSPMKPPSKLILSADLRAALRSQLPLRVVNSIGMAFVEIPAGEFMMGSPDSDSDGTSDERPQTQVHITKPFYLGATEVTQGQYKEVMRRSPSHFKESGPDAPVEQVSWGDAQDFCRKLSELAEEKKAGRRYRLPTEAEWEYACRAGSTGQYCIGNDESTLGDYAWYGKNSDGKTHQVGRKKPNGWGLYDVHGNVWEWCADWNGCDYYSSRRGKYDHQPVDPSGPRTGSERVIRGGSWIISPGSCRTANRSGDSPDGRIIILGFRVALAATEE